MYQTTWPASWEICMQVKKQQSELDMEQQTGSKLGKEYIKAVYCHLAYLTSMQSEKWKFASDSATPGTTVHGTLQAKILVWVNLPFSRGSSQLRDWIQVSCIAGRFFTIWATKEVLLLA